MVARILSLVIPVLLVLASCKGKDEPIPAYLHVDSVSLSTSSSQGNNIHDIQFIYAYLNGDLLGVFELPATIPVHAQGKNKISFSPAVLLNGSKNFVTAHTGLLPTDTMVDFTRGKVSAISNISFVFRPNSNFVWLEDFEDNTSSVSIISAEKGDTAFISSEPFDLNGRFSGMSNIYNVTLKASDTLKYIDLGSFKSFGNLPNDSREVFLEFDIKSDISVQLAMKRTTSIASYVPYLFIYSTENKWKHFYVNLNYETSNQPNGTTYQILFSGNVPADSQDHLIQLDNIRLSYNN